jgi:hypothetical protein
VVRFLFALTSKVSDGGSFHAEYYEYKKMYLVRLTRSACSGSAGGQAVTPQTEHCTRLLAMDYYDQMAYTEYESFSKLELEEHSKQRRPNAYFFGQYDLFDKDPVHPPLSHLLMTLVEIEGMSESYSGDPFASKNREGSHPESPFLSLINITRVPSFQEPDPKDGVSDYCVGRDIEYRELELRRDENNVWLLERDSFSQPETREDNISSLLSAFMADRTFYIGTPSEIAETLSTLSDDKISERAVKRRLLQNAEELKKLGISLCFYVLGNVKFPYH